MVTCKLMGRLGNQAFMIAATIGYARKHGIDYCIPRITIAPNIWESYWAHLSNCSSGLREPLLLQETTHEYQELPAPLDERDIVLEGYFQSEKYFEHCREEIVRLFMPKWEMTRQVVSVHVRRGDYLQLEDKHPTVTEGYLLAAINEIKSRVGSSVLFYFMSDDLDWVYVFAETHLRGMYVISHIRTPMEDLQAMAQCEHNIISNSSFSWWGAWLNQNPNKIVIAPKIWFGPGNAHLSDKDILPDQWIRV